MITIRPATIADTGAIVHLEMTIIDQMQIPMVEKLGRDNIEQLLHDSALADDTARYSHKHATVAEMSGAIVGVAFGYPAKQEPYLDVSLQRLLADRFGELAELFPDKETVGQEWYLDSISVSVVRALEHSYWLLCQLWRKHKVNKSSGLMWMMATQRHVRCTNAKDLNQLASS